MKAVQYCEQAAQPWEGSDCTSGMSEFMPRCHFSNVTNHTLTVKT